MTYDTALARPDAHFGFYVKFDGVAELFATVSSWPGSSGTILPVLLAAPTSSGDRLDRERGLVTPGKFDFEIADSADVRVLLARRGGTEFALTTTLSESASVVSTNNEGLAGLTVYVEQETITVGTHSGGGVYAGCTRGVEDSTAKAHLSNSVGSTRPRHWIHRRAQLHAVNLRTGDTSAVLTGIVIESPKYVDGRHVFGLAGLMRELNRRLYQGWQSVPVTLSSRDNAARTITFDVNGDARNFSVEQDSQIRLDFSGAAWLVDLDKDDISRASRQFTVSMDADTQHGIMGLRGREGGGTDANGHAMIDVFSRLPDLNARTAAVIWGDPAMVALQVMLSRYGDGVNHADHDNLPGVSPDLASDTIDLVGKRIGAGLPAAWVDVDSWADQQSIASVARFVIDRTRSLMEFLEQEIVWRLGGIVYITGAGKIAFQRDDPAVASSSIVTYDTSDIARSSVTTVDDESDILAAGEFKHNWDHITGDFMGLTQVAWPDTAGTYGDNHPQLQMESQSLVINSQTNSGELASGVTTTDGIVVGLDRRYSRTRNGVRRLTWPVPWQLSGVFSVGYRFKHTNAYLIDHEGGLGVTARHMEVVATVPDFPNGVILVTAEERNPGFLIAPAAMIDSYDGGTKTITFDTASHEGDVGTAAPSGYFPDGAEVFIADDDFITQFGRVEKEVISSLPTPTTMVLVNGPATFTPAAGDLVWLAWQVNTGTAATATDADVDDHLFLADANNPPTLASVVAADRGAMTWE